MFQRCANNLYMFTCFESVRALPFVYCAKTTTHINKHQQLYWLWLNREQQRQLPIVCCICFAFANNANGHANCMRAHTLTNTVIPVTSAQQFVHQTKYEHTFEWEEKPNEFRRSDFNLKPSLCPAKVHWITYAHTLTTCQKSITFQSIDQLQHCTWPSETTNATMNEKKNGKMKRKS